MPKWYLIVLKGDVHSTSCEHLFTSIAAAQKYADDCRLQCSIFELTCLRTNERDEIAPWREV